MSEIKPALTPEEWAAGGTNNGEVAVTAEPDIRVHEMHSTVCVDEDLRHALAALCLHGQPFGFTREMAQFIRASDVDSKEEAEMRDAIVARIEALLPPESR